MAASDRRQLCAAFGRYNYGKGGASRAVHVVGLSVRRKLKLCTVILDRALQDFIIDLQRHQLDRNRGHTWKLTCRKYPVPNTDRNSAFAPSGPKTPTFHSSLDRVVVFVPAIFNSFSSSCVGANFENSLWNVRRIETYSPPRLTLRNLTSLPKCIRYIIV